MTEVDENAAIEQVLDFTGLDPVADRSLIISHLKSKNFNVEEVITSYFNDEVKFRQLHTWDESAFRAGRDGSVEGVPTFNIHAPDDGSIIRGVSPMNLHAGAPSRPPSRNQSPLSRLIDLTARDAAGTSPEAPNRPWLTTPIGAPATRAEEETDLQRALAESAAMSAGMSGLQSPQENGVTEPAESNLPFFGPATREEYDPAQWAMVPTTRESAEPGPSGRKRIEGAPAFLRCRKSGYAAHKLGGILTILHAIPEARNILLNAGTSSGMYGHNKEWWKGEMIPSAHQQLQQQQQQQQYQNAGVDDGEEARRANAADFFDELHRLMAFLDATDRSYGTADVLADLEVLRNDTSWQQDPERSFFDALSRLVDADIRAPLWTKAEIISIADGEVIEEDNFALLELNLNYQQWKQVRSLYNALDDVYWPDMLVDETSLDYSGKMAVIKAIGDVAMMRLCGSGVEQAFDIPEVIYFDRYLEDNAKEVLQLQAQLRSIQNAITKGDKAREELVRWRPATSGDGVDGPVGDVERGPLSRQIIERDMQRLWKIKSDALWRRHEESRGTPKEFDFQMLDVADALDLDEQEDIAAQSLEAEITAHEQQLKEIDRKMARLKAEQEACQTAFQKLSLRLTEPSEAQGWRPKHKFTLRGVSTSPETVYVCRREDPDLIQMDEGGDSSAPSRDQWWKLAYLPKESEPIKVEKTTLEAVQKAACEEGEKRPLLVYANDRAMEAAPLPLPDGLRNFVRFDNRLFKQELIEETPREQGQQQQRGEDGEERERGREERKRSSSVSPSSPSKKQQRSGSADSMATNRASMGDLSDREMWDVDDTDVDATLNVNMHVAEPFEDEGFSEPDRAQREAEEERRAQQEPRSDPTLGTEMVQLSISRPLVVAGAGGAASTLAVDQDGARPSVIEVEDAECIADWDNPEGKPLGGTGGGQQ